MPAWSICFFQTPGSEGPDAVMEALELFGKKGPSRVVAKRLCRGQLEEPILGSDRQADIVSR